MKKKSINYVRWLGAVLITCGVFSSCIREEKPNINLDIESVNSGSSDPAFTLRGQGIVKTTIQENGITLYADSTADLSNLQLTINVSDGATASFIDVDLNSVDYKVTDPSTNTEYTLTRIDTVVKNVIDAPKDFSKTRFLKVTCQAEGLNEDDKTTQGIINSQKATPGFLGWEKDGKLSKEYTEGAHLYKIWSIHVLPAGIPTLLTFDNWNSIQGTEYKLPYEMIKDSKGNLVESDIWSSTNASIALMAKTNPLVKYGAQQTDSVAKQAARGSDNKSALLLCSNDIRYTKTYARPFLAGCCFIGEYDGSDNGALTCTHVGLPFNKLPESLTFWYKYLPMKIIDPNTGYSGFTVPGIENYVGQDDKGFIRAVLYRADNDSAKWLNGESIRDINNKYVIAYAEFAPQRQESYVQHTEQFTYVRDVNSEDLKNWKYNLAIYFASSYDGFRFICGANMTPAMIKLQTLSAQLKEGTITQQDYNIQAYAIMNSQMGSQLFIDEMEINCK